MWDVISNTLGADKCVYSFQISHFFKYEYSECQMFTFIDVIVFLFCFVSVTVLKYYDQKQEFILAYNSKEGVHSAQEGMEQAPKQGWQITFHLHMGEQEWECPV